MENKENIRKIRNMKENKWKNKENEKKTSPNRKQTKK